MIDKLPKHIACKKMSNEDYSTYLSLGNDKNPCFLYENGIVKVFRPVELGTRVSVLGLTAYGFIKGMDQVQRSYPRVHMGILCSLAAVVYSGISINGMYAHQVIMKKLGFQVSRNDAE